MPSIEGIRRTYNDGLFAFKSPLSKGALLADEVGLGKTIEAGLVLSQKDQVDRQREELIAQIESKLAQTTRGERLFAVRWRLA